jgi:nitrate reductase gamma subunit
MISQLIPAKIIAYNFISGPLVWISFIVFAVGIAIQTYRFKKMTKEINHSHMIPKKEFSPQSKKPESRRETFFRKISFLRLSVLGVNPLLVVVSFVFHLCLFITPIFLLAHNVLLEQFLGTGLFSFSQSASHTLTGIVLACGLFFGLRRLIIRRVRAITSFYDFVMLGLVITPFLTGFLAHQNIYNYNIMIFLHILSAEILLILIPFSKFFHMVFFFIGRFLVINEHSLGTPNRSWQF